VGADGKLFIGITKLLGLTKAVSVIHYHRRQLGKGTGFPVTVLDCSQDNKPTQIVQIAAIDVLLGPAPPKLNPLALHLSTEVLDRLWSH
jgi:hypothetical protein